MNLTAESLSRHLYVLGTTGVGKSRALATWIIQLVLALQGVGVIDSHGELVDLVVAWIAYHAPELANRFVILDPLHPTHALGFNPLELHPGEVPERKAQFLATVITKIFNIDPNIAARMERIMLHTFWLLIHAHLTLVEFALVLTDADIRVKLLYDLPESSPLRRYWLKEFPKAPHLATEWIQSSLNKVGEMVLDPDLAAIFGQQQSTIDFRAIMDQRKVLLVRIPKGRLGVLNSQRLGAFVAAEIQLAALSRENTSQRTHPQWVLVLDEFQTYISDDIETILTESRKFNLALVLCHQHLAQMRDQPKLQAAILNTVGNMALFRIGSDDANILGTSMFTPELDVMKDIHVRKQPTGIDWFPYTTEYEAVWRPLNEIWEIETRQLTLLKDREFWYKQKGPHQAELLTSFDLPAPPPGPHLDEAIRQLIERSTRYYGRLKPEVHADISRRMNILLHSSIQQPTTRLNHAEEVPNAPPMEPPPPERPKRRSPSKETSHS